MKVFRDLFLLGAAVVSLGASDGSAPDTQAARRDLLDRFESEYVHWKETSAAGRSENLKHKGPDLQYKIKAPLADSGSPKPGALETQAADAFLKELISGQTAKRPEQASEEAALKMHEQALRYVAQDKLDDAVHLYEDIVLSHPEDDEAYLLMGHCCLLLGRYERAEQAFENAVHIDPQNGGEITPFYENCVLENPDDDGAYTNLGYAYLMTADLPKAHEAFWRALEINPRNQTAQSGVILIKQVSQSISNP